MKQELDNLSQELKKSQELFAENEGYLKLIQNKDPVSHDKFKKAMIDVS